MRSVSLERLPKRRFSGVPGAWEIVVMITPRPSKRISTPRSIVLVDTILPSLAGQYLRATIRRRRPANAVVVSGPMKGLDLTQSMFEASNLDGSIISSLPQSRSSLIILYQGSMTSGQKPGFARNSVPLSCSHRRDLTTLKLSSYALYRQRSALKRGGPADWDVASQPAHVTPLL